MEFSQLIESRRSIRNYKKDMQITPDQIRVLIDAAQQAPSWKNTETGRYYAVLSPDMILKIRETALPAFNAERTENAVALIVTSFVKAVSGFRNDQTPENELGDEWGAYDLGLQNENLILKARETGYDTLIMGIRDAGHLRELLDIPENEEIVSVISVGVREDDPKKPVRKPMDEILKFF